MIKIDSEVDFEKEMEQLRFETPKYETFNTKEK
jgi:hypothetical protein